MDRKYTDKLLDTLRTAATDDIDDIIDHLHQRVARKSTAQYAARPESEDPNVEILLNDFWDSSSCFPTPAMPAESDHLDSA
jgi:hypothetical protein